MKTKITIATLLFGFTVNAQLEKFEGLWHSKDTTHKTLITHRIVYNPNILSMKYIRKFGHN